MAIKNVNTSSNNGQRGKMVIEIDTNGKVDLKIEGIQGEACSVYMGQMLKGQNVVRHGTTAEFDENPDGDMPIREKVTA